MCSQLRQLWVKENVADPPYVDIFGDFRSTSIFRENILEQINVDENQKDDALATQYRKCGNKFTEQNDFKAAIEEYNKSLCFAENDTVASFAYANRAFCFLELELYDQCLFDIELAVKARYPDNLMEKLKQRRAACLKRMDTSNQRAPLIEPQLSFAAHDKVKNMANVLSVRKNEEFGRHLVAKCDIEEDQVVMMEEPLVKLVDDTNKYKRCNCCLKQYTSTLPCGMCTKVLFCVGSCSSSVDLHKYECNMKHLKFFDSKAGNVAANCVKFVIRTIVNLLETFTSYDELMESVELQRKKRSTSEVIIADGSVRAMTGILFTQHHLVPYQSGQIQVLIISCFTYDYIMDHSILKTNFPTLKIQRFLMHLVTQFVSIFTVNNILLQEWSDKLSDIIDHNSTETFGIGLFNISSLINHSCMPPNVVRLTTANQAIIKTIRPIKQGEQIFVRYAIDPNWTTALRQQHLLNYCGFYCTCKLCLSNGPLLADVSVISMELADLTVELSPLIFLRVKEAHKWKELKEKLFKFTKKYENFPVSKNIILSYEYIKMILLRELSFTA